MRGSGRPKGFGLFNTGPGPGPRDAATNMMTVMPPEEKASGWRPSPELAAAMAERKLAFVMDGDSRVEVGRGAFAKAYLARNTEDAKQELVIKEVDLSILKEDQRKKAGLEVTFLKSLNHENVIRCHDAFNTANVLHIVLDYASGGTLAMRIEAKRKEEATFTKQEVLRWFAQLLAALRHLHGSRVLHRDLKTANVFIDSYNRLKLGDFGLSRKIDDDENFSGQQVGTPYYFAPEVVKAKPFSNKTDIWSAAVIAYELAFLKKPFQAKSIKGLYRKIENAEYDPIPDTADDDIRRLLTSILLVEPRERPGAAKLCRDAALEEYVTCDLPMRTPPRKPSLPPSRPAQGSKKSGAVAKFLLSVSGQCPAAAEVSVPASAPAADPPDEYCDDFEDATSTDPAEDSFDDDCDYDDDFESFDDEELHRIRELVAIH